MPIEAITFRADSELIEAIRERAKQLGVSVNVAIGNMLAPVLGRTRSAPSATRPRNDLMRFCGCLKDVDAEAMRKAQKDFETIDEEMWK